MTTFLKCRRQVRQPLYTVSIKASGMLSALLIVMLLCIFSSPVQAFEEISVVSPLANQGVNYNNSPDSVLSDVFKAHRTDYCFQQGKPFVTRSPLGRQDQSRSGPSAHIAPGLVFGIKVPLKPQAGNKQRKTVPRLALWSLSSNRTIIDTDQHINSGCN